MDYRHAPAADRADLDAVLVSAPGRPTLPVRLTLELFGRALALAGGGPVTVWDPCCGSGTTLAVLGLCRGPALSGLLGSDVDPAPLELARRNLALVDPGGLGARAVELDALADRHGKPGYASAAAAARALAAGTSLACPASPDAVPAQDVTRARHATPSPGAASLPYEVVVADATDPAATLPLLDRHRPQVVIADLPHGIQTRWTATGTRPGTEAGPGAAAGTGPGAAAGTGPGDGPGPGAAAGAGPGDGPGPAAAAGAGPGDWPGTGGGETERGGAGSVAGIAGADVVERGAGERDAGERDAGGGSGVHAPGGGAPSDDLTSELVTALAAVLAPDAVIALAGRGRRLTLPRGTRTLDRFRVGHRAMAIIRAGDVLSSG